MAISTAKIVNGNFSAYDENGRQLFNIGGRFNENMGDEIVNVTSVNIVVRNKTMKTIFVIDEKGRTISQRVEY